MNGEIVKNGDNIKTFYYCVHRLKALFSQMKNDSKLVLIEFKEGKLPEGPPEDIKILLGKMVSITTNAGFVNLKQNDELLPYQYYLEFKKQ